MSIDDPEVAVPGKVFIDKDNKVSLQDALKEFMLSHPFCILELEGRFITIFKHKGGYWFFDPEGRDAIGDIFRNPEHHVADNCYTKFPTNVACVMRYVSLKNMLLNFEDNLLVKDKNVDFVIHSVVIKRKILKNFDPPISLEAFSAKNRFLEMKKAKSQEALRAQTATSTRDPSTTIDPTTASKKTVDTSAPDPARLQELARKPIEKPKEPSITHFTSIFANKIGIMRAKYHQNDPNFSRYAGKQSLANAVAAITMLREHKSRYWIKKTLDEVLVIGEQIYGESKKNLIGDQVLGIKELTDLIRISNNR